MGVEIKFHLLPIILKYILQGFTIKILKTYTGEWEKYIRLEVNTINTMKIGNEGKASMLVWTNLQKRKFTTKHTVKVKRWIPNLTELANSSKTQFSKTVPE